MASFGKRCAQAAFGSSNIATKIKAARKTEAIVDGASVVWDGRAGSLMDRKRAIVSHVEGHARGLAEFLETSADESSGVFVPSVYDDATMWVRPHVGGDRAGGEGEDVGEKAGEKHKGRNVHAPVINRSEVLVVMPKAGSHAMPRGANIYSPADAMPRANWATIWSRWRRWAVLNGGMPGARVDREQRVRPALRKAKRRLLNFCKDALGLNRLLLGKLQAAAAACRGTQDEFHVYHQGCVAHQTVLSMKPSIDRIPGVSSNLVRLGHLFQSSHRL